MCEKTNHNDGLTGALIPAKENDGKKGHNPPPMLPKDNNGQEIPPPSRVGSSPKPPK